MSCILFTGWLVSFLVFISYVICFRINNNLKPFSFLKLYSKINDLNILNETIYGLSSGIPEGGCGVAVVRISGPDSIHTLNLLTKKSDNVPYKPRFVKLCKLYSLINNNLIDEPLTLYFKSPNSYTGDDVVEIHTHGNEVIIKELFDNFRHIANNYNIKLRQAERGEFTRRAYYSNKLNLIQVESINELIRSKNHIQKQNSILKVIWTNDLIDIISKVEASIDFQEESCSDIILMNTSSILDPVQNLTQEIFKFINDKKETIVDGIKLLLLGPTNSGKSSFINNLFNDDISIVSNIPGTTRDLIRVNYNLNGLNYQIIDSAGINNRILDGITNWSESSDCDAIELIGIKKALDQIETSNVILFLFDPLNVNDSLSSLHLLLNLLNKAKIPSCNVTNSINTITPFGFTDTDNGLPDNTQQNSGSDCKKLVYVCINKSDLIEDVGFYKKIIFDFLNTEVKNTNGESKKLDFEDNFKILQNTNLDRNVVKNVMSLINEDIVNHFNLNASSIFIDNQRHKSHLNKIIKHLNTITGSFSLIERF
ncbi:trna modification gtpase, putative [Theileria annulata]|uniref:Trna modification gtpase, putative n=1 Tax=Theileria annulata TaxID=5874 RepID=Q4UAQ7_THEAN|nr:trna modification gtpase, putative [Theileria annulata]CAI76094.1 trna modification gtpase, putative [Theileria annulata]|eukprot:XP_952720.1 trna modification gtpase, putative [Theileria annulata]